MDTMIIGFITTLLDFHKHKLGDQEINALVVDNKRMGGLEFVLPGVYYELMKSLQSAIESGKAEELYAKLKKQFFDARPAESKNAMIAYVLNDPYTDLRDEEVRHLINLKFNQASIYCNDDESCLLCKSKIYDNHHKMCCRKSRGHLIFRHNIVVRAIIAKICNKQKGMPVSKQNKNLPDDGLLPDIEFEYNGQKWIIDVRFAKPGTE